MSIADKARKIPGVAAAEGAVTGAVATEEDLPIADYDKQTAEDIAAKLNGFSQRELRLVGAYEPKHHNRATITDRSSRPSSSPRDGLVGVLEAARELLDGRVLARRVDDGPRVAARAPRA